MQANQITPTPTVMRSRFLSATDEPPSAAGDATAEHVGQATAAALVEQDHHDQQQAGEHEQRVEEREPREGILPSASAVQRTGMS